MRAAAKKLKAFHLRISIRMTKFQFLLGLERRQKKINRDFQKKTREERKERCDYENSPWAEMLRNPDLKNPRSAQARTFRRRFRVPYAMFLEIVRLAEL